MNVTDIAPVQTDQSSRELVLDCLFLLVALYCFVRVASYALRQVRLGTLVGSPRAPMTFPIPAATGWAFAAGIMLLVLCQSVYSALIYVLIPVGLWVFLAAARRSGDYQFGLSRLNFFLLVRWSLVICGAVFFIELPLSHIVERLMNWLQVPHPPQESVMTFQQLQGASQIIQDILFVCIVGPVTEELFFRGFLFSFLKRFTTPWLAIVLSAGVFAFAHVNLGSAIPLWFLGIVLATAYEHTGSLFLPIGIHGCFNLVTAITLLAEKGSS